jgi:PIN domain nuclease of toxin-antitoxin system
MDRVHFIEGDTDSMYWAVAGNLEEDNSQGFKNVIKITLFIISMFMNSFLEIFIAVIIQILSLKQNLKKWHSQIKS